VKCPTPVDGRESYLNRQRARASVRPDAATRSADWQAESDRANKAAADAQQSVDEAMRRADEIERSLNEMKARMRKNQDGKRPNHS
jgi:chromosome segregation ATPase